MNSCLRNCKPGDILVWHETSEHVVTEVIGALVWARGKRSGYVGRFHSQDVTDGSISKIIKKRDEVIQSNPTFQ